MASMRVLVVVAHPDDESFGCGSLLALAARNGHTTGVLCASRGEAGESRIVVDDLAATREGELHDAARVLGVGTVVLLDHADSGMAGEPPAGALVNVADDVLASQIATVIDEWRPDVVVTLDASDGHRDHVAVRDATLHAVERNEHRPQATYLWCLARSSMQRWAAHMAGTTMGDTYDSIAGLGTPDHEITTRLDVAHVLDTRWRSIRAHASQASPYDTLPAELQHEFLAVDRLRLVDGDDVLAAVFAGGFGDSGSAPTRRTGRHQASRSRLLQTIH